jgi:hypothetical protein
MLVRIYQPLPSVDKGCRAHSPLWRIAPALSGARKREPLMGWIAAPDGLAALEGQLRFVTLEAAVSFAKRRGWEAEILAPAANGVTPRSFMDNFRIMRPEDEERLAAEKTKNDSRA